MDEEKKLITYFSHSELHTIGTTDKADSSFNVMLSVFSSASKTLKGIEAMNMIKKRQVNKLNCSALNEVKYIN